MIEDKHLIDEIKSGNMQLFSKLVDKYQQMVFGIAIGFTHIKEDAEDITQDTFINVFKSISSFQYYSKFSTWLYRIAINTSINYLKTNKKYILFQSLSNVLNKASTIATPIEQLEADERSQIIQKAIDNLNIKQRTAFILRRFDELSQREIAEIMNISEGAVEQLLQRAKINLQKRLNKTVGK